MEMKHYTYESKYGTYEDCYFQLGRYTNNNLAVFIVSRTEGPITKVTINPDTRIPDTMIAIKDYSENEGMVDWLISMDIIERDPVFTIPSGYVDVPVHLLTRTGKEILGLE